MGGQALTDDYAWMEDARSPEVHAWVAEKNRISEETLSRAPGAETLLTEMQRAVGLPRSAPFQYGDRQFSYRLDEPNMPWKLVVDEPGGKARVLLDPATFEDLKEPQCVLSAPNSKFEEFHV